MGSKFLRIWKQKPLYSVYMFSCKCACNNLPVWFVPVHCSPWRKWWIASGSSRSWTTKSSASWINTSMHLMLEMASGRTWWKSNLREKMLRDKWWPLWARIRAKSKKLESEKAWRSILIQKVDFWKIYTYVSFVCVHCTVTVKFCLSQSQVLGSDEILQLFKMCLLSFFFVHGSLH